MSRRVIRLLLVLNLLACAAITIFWIRAHREHTSLIQALLRTRTTHEKAAIRAGDLQQQLSERRALIDERRRQIAAAPRSIELQRRAAALVAIARLKEERLLHPPPPPRLPRPPRVPGTNTENVFPELLTDPEYSAHALSVRKRWDKITYGRHLRKIGVDDATIDKVAQLYAESVLLRLDYRSMLGDAGSEQAQVTALRQNQLEEMDAEIEALLGKEKYAQFHAAYDTDQRISIRSRLEPLASRLSYSNSPLATETIDQLTALLKQLEVPAGSDWAILADPVVDAARTVLNPEQHAAFRQLQAELQAKQKRAQLPASSQIPRL